MGEKGDRSTTAGGPLEGFRVVDLTSVIMGPVASRTLGDLGADVITVEGLRGEMHRGMNAGPHPQLSGIALNLLRNKRSLAIDLKSEDGHQVFLDLAATADVLITNLRPGPVRRLGLDHEAVRIVRPDIVYCQAHGWASDSDDAEAPAYDDIIQSATGVGDMFLRAGLEPALLPTLVADKVCGLAIANAVMAALLHRAATGEGQHVEVPMFDVMRAFMLTEHGAGAIGEPRQDDPGHRRILTRHRRPQPTVDGWINVLPYEQGHYEAIFTAGGRTDVRSDERFRTRAGRFANSDSLYRDVAAILATRTTDEWLVFCREHGIPATAAATLDELVAGLPLAEHPVAGTYRHIPVAERFSQSPVPASRPAPLIGEHGRQLLTELGYSEGRIDELVASGVLVITEPSSEGSSSLTGSSRLDGHERNGDNDVSPSLPPIRPPDELPSL
jgi:crotonobetainyl-CoA:carnitine CoA-transferase CaiB-like acyl-CoA transferase